MLFACLLGHFSLLLDVQKKPMKASICNKVPGGGPRGPAEAAWKIYRPFRKTDLLAEPSGLRPVFRPEVPSLRTGIPLGIASKALFNQEKALNFTTVFWILIGSWCKKRICSHKTDTTPPLSKQRCRSPEILVWYAHAHTGSGFVTHPRCQRSRTDGDIATVVVTESCLHCFG